MNHQQQGVCSTKTHKKHMEEVDTASTKNKKERDVYVKVVDIWDTKGTIYTNQKVQFPIKAQSVSRYVMVMVAINSNAILVTPIKNQKDLELERAYLELLKRVQLAGIEVRKIVLDNECSTNMKELIKNTCKLELVPPGCHRRNMVEVGIRTFKSPLSPSYQVSPHSFPYRCGTSYSCKQN